MDLCRYLPEGWAAGSCFPGEILTIQPLAGVSDRGGWQISGDTGGACQNSVRLYSYGSSYCLGVDRTVWRCAAF